jgi:hypothetical protein
MKMTVKRKALSPHDNDHPFHKMSPEERNAVDADSSFIADDYYTVPLSSKDESLFQVIDWERKQKHCPHPEKVKVMNETFRQVGLLVDIYESPNWKFHSENKLGNKVWTMTSDEGVNAVKGECIIPYSATDLFYMITDMGDDRKIFDPLFNRCELIEKYGQNTFLMWQLTNRIGPIYPREFLGVVHGNIVSFKLFLNKFSLRTAGSSS